METRDASDHRCAGGRATMCAAHPTHMKTARSQRPRRSFKHAEDERPRSIDSLRVGVQRFDRTDRERLLPRLQRTRSGRDLERRRQPQLLANLAHRGHYLGCEQADIVDAILLRDRAVVLPEGENPGAQHFQHFAQLGDDRLRGPADDLHRTLDRREALEDLAARLLDVDALVLPYAGARLDLRVGDFFRDGPRRDPCPRAALGRSRVGELARDALGGILGIISGREHPLRLAEQAVADTGAAEHVPLRDLVRLFLSLGDVHFLQVAEIFRPDLVTLFRRGVAIHIPQLHRRFEERRQRDIRVTMLRAPDYGLGTEQPWNPDRRMRFLDRQAPRIDEAVVEMLALVAERTRPGPRLDHDVVGFVEIFAVKRGVRVAGELLAAAAAYPSGHQAAAGDHIDHAQLFGQPQRIADYRQRIAQQDDLHFLGDAREDRGLNVHHRAHAEGGIVMLVEHDAVEAEFFGEDFLVEVLVEQLTALDGVEILVRDAEETSLDDFVVGYVPVRTLRKVHHMHRYVLPVRISLKSLRPLE